MVCAACGAPVVDGVKFCAKCGAAVAAAPFQGPAQGQGQPVYAAQPVPVAGHYGVPYVARLRVARNLQTLGILWYVFAAYRALAGVIGFFALHFFASRGNFSPGWPFNHSYMNHGSGWMAALAPLIAVYVVMTVALAVFTGYSLLSRKPWGRTLAIIVAVLALLKFPFGTALGIFTLWVMAPGESGMEWEAMADRS